MATNESSGRWDASGSFDEACDYQRSLARNWALGLTRTQLIHAILTMSEDSNAFTLYERKVHSGDCIGADKEFHDIAKSLGHWSVGHPPLNFYKRAFCDFDEERRPQEFLVRNKIIVDESDQLIATPKGFVEELRSGTWSTIRYARKNVTSIVIVWPDGRVTEEGNEL